MIVLRNTHTAPIIPSMNECLGKSPTVKASMHALDRLAFTEGRMPGRIRYYRISTTKYINRTISVSIDSVSTVILITCTQIIDGTRSTDMWGEYITQCHASYGHLPIAFVSSRLRLRIENLNFALTSCFGHCTSNKYSDK